MSNLTYQDIGQHGVKWARDEKNGLLYLVVPCTEAAAEKAPLSKSGKTKLVASTGGFVRIGHVSLNLTVTAPTA